MTGKFKLTFAMMLAAATAAGAIYAQEAPADAPGQYRIDWNGGFLEVTAEGASDPDKTINQADGMKQAMAVACDLALEKLAETIGGVNITANTTYKDVFRRDSSAREHVETIVKESRILKNKVDVMDDGSALGVCVRGMRLKGSDSLAAKTFSIPAVRQVIKESVTEDTPAIVEKAEAPAPAPAAAPAEKRVTGLIVDVRGLLTFQTGLTVKIVSADGKTVYSAETVDAGRLAGGEMVKYSLSEEDARKSVDRVGKTPLLVKAVKVIENAPNTVVVSTEDAQKILLEAAKAGFLKAGNVVFII